MRIFHENYITARLDFKWRSRNNAICFALNAWRAHFIWKGLLVGLRARINVKEIQSVWRNVWRQREKGRGNPRARSLYANDFNPLGDNSLPALPVLPVNEARFFRWFKVNLSWALSRSGSYYLALFKREFQEIYGVTGPLHYLINVMRARSFPREGTLTRIISRIN